jgi:hypothetical protein
MTVMPWLRYPGAKLQAIILDFTLAGSDPPDEAGDTLSSHGVSHDVLWT